MSAFRSTRLLAVSALLAAGLVTAGCGGASGGDSTSAASGGGGKEQPTMGELYTKVRTASLAAKSGHLSGTVTDGGEKLTLEIEGLADGSNQKASIGMGGGTAEILSVAKSYYMGGDAKFWTEQTGDAAAAKALKGKYVEISAADAKEIGDLTIGSLLEEMFKESELSVLEKLTSDVETRTEGGAQVWVAKDGSGSEIWVDPKSERLVKIVVGGSEPGSLTFDKWDAAATFKKPAASKIVKP